MRRFERLWSEWEAKLAGGAPADSLLSSLTDEDIIELLAGAPDAEHRRVARNVLATEALNRMSRGRHAIARMASDVSETLLRLKNAVIDGAIAAREEEAWLDDEGRAAREAARQAAIDHARATGAVAAMDDLARRVGELRRDALAHARDPERYLEATTT